MDSITERQSPQLTKATELRGTAAITLEGMRRNLAQTPLGGSRDPRVEIGIGVGEAENEVESLRARLKGELQAPVTQTPAGKAALERLAREVGHQLPQTIPADKPPIAQEIQPTSSSTVFGKLVSFFKK